MGVLASGEKSRVLFERAKELFPGGVNSPVRAAVKPYPFYVERGEGAYLYTVDGARIVDLVLAYGPLILGHKHPRVLEAVEEALARGWLYGAPGEAEVLLAEKILGYVKRGGMIRFVNSGTEATMTAIRLARGYTRRDLILKFDGCYHGSHDAVLVAAGSAAAHYGVPTSAGVPEAVARLTLVAPYNDVEALERVFAEYGDRIAGVIVEPVIANAGVIPPHREFLVALQRLSRESGALLILDEVVTGFRLGLEGAQGYFNIEGDIVVLGKIIGGGFPVGAVAGSREVMSLLTPQGKVFNAGTFNAHPITMAAGLATLKALEEEPVYRVSREAAKALEEAASEVLDRTGLPYTINRVESMMQLFIGVEEVSNAAQARKADQKLYVKLHEEMLRRGVFIAPSNLEAVFTGLPHQGEALEIAVEGLRSSLKTVLGS
ncbi:chain A, crystal structure of glutamate-1-semialdehyde 2,1-aminomutase [Aeropyrum pernix]|uniref:Glutamate-1-semialdehyde 2,1-aminomutase n=1 Tax=Aeropyrum pernix TaxID=56636 RepID=A0A401H7A1_AERPX|nr:chain A, crystal structure of glutamate-1-semialdehyde 2,1-aminomutase [Aeropyrum pernix]